MPNLGNRNKRVYGPIASIEALQTYVKEVGAKLGVTIEAFASNHEGCILDEIHRTAAQCDAYILNPAGLTKTGEPTRHALEETGKPWIEVHFSNISAPPWFRRPWRCYSVLLERTQKAQCGPHRQTRHRIADLTSRRGHGELRSKKRPDDQPHQGRLPQDRNIHGRDWPTP